MATLYIAEYSRLMAATNGEQQPQIVDVSSLVAEQTITVGSEVDSSAFGAATRIVRLCSDTACHILFGTGNPAATTSKAYLPANAPEYFGVPPGQSYKVSAIAHS